MHPYKSWRRQVTLCEMNQSTRTLDRRARDTLALEEVAGQNDSTKRAGAGDGARETVERTDDTV